MISINKAKKAKLSDLDESQLAISKELGKGFISLEKVQGEGVTFDREPSKEQRELWESMGITVSVNKAQGADSINSSPELVKQFREIQKKLLSTGHSLDEINNDPELLAKFRQLQQELGVDKTLQNSEEGDTFGRDLLSRLRAAEERRNTLNKGANTRNRLDFIQRIKDQQDKS